MKATILLVDDNESFLSQFADLLAEEGDYNVIPLISSRKALETLDRIAVDAIISDIQMPEMSGIDFFRSVQESHPDIPVIFITAFSSTTQAVQLVKQGAFHYFEKPVIDHLDLFHTTIREAVAKGRMRRELQALQTAKSLQMPQPVTIIGQSPGLKKVLQAVEEVANLPVTVLIFGETGTGKDLVARAVYESGNRRQGGFFAVNCGAFTEGVLESELFGHEKGSFTGALSRKKGLFEVADHGTLFLDEISEATHTLQTKLLRVLEAKTFTRVGGTAPISSDFRIIAATNRNLDALAVAGRFRQDLLYRLKVYTIAVPPLRERKEDIPLLAEFFLKKYCAAYGREINGISVEAILFLREYAWPGNVRELINVMERAVITCRNGLITLKHLPFQQDGNDTWESSKAWSFNLKEAERFLIRMALQHSGGHRVKAAEMLGINRKTLTEKLKGFGMEGND